MGRAVKRVKRRQKQTQKSAVVAAPFVREPVRIDHALVDELMKKMLEKMTLPELFIQRLKAIPHNTDQEYYPPNSGRSSKFIFSARRHADCPFVVGTWLGSIVYPWAAIPAFVVLGDVDVGFGLNPGAILKEVGGVGA